MWRGSRRAATGPAKGAVESLHAALHVAPAFEREPAPGPLFHPGKSARVAAGIVGELHPALLEGAWGAFELDLAALVEAAPERVEYEDVITFPALRQDIAVAVPRRSRPGPSSPRRARRRRTGAARGACLRRLPRRAGGRGAEVGGAAALFQSPERTLSDEDAAALRERIVAALAERFGAELRA